MSSSFGTMTETLMKSPESRKNMTALVSLRTSVDGISLGEILGLYFLKEEK